MRIDVGWPRVIAQSNPTASSCEGPPRVGGPGGGGAGQGRADVRGGFLFGGEWGTEDVQRALDDVGRYETAATSSPAAAAARVSPSVRRPSVPT